MCYGAAATVCAQNQFTVVRIGETMRGTAVDISQRGIDLIVSFEGKYTRLPDGRYKSYLDKLAKPPVWTVYCGLTKGIGSDTCVTVEEADRMFAKELAIYEDAVEQHVTVPLNQNQFDALVSFVYNCGPGALKGSTLLKLLNQGHYEQVPAQLMRWTHAGGKEYAGLVRRRKAEGALFMEPMPAELPPHPEEIPPEIAAVPPSPDVAVPQRVEVKPVATVGEAVAGSWTLRGALLAAAGTLARESERAYDWAVGIVKQAGPEITSLKTSLSPFDALVKLTPALLVALTLVGLWIVVARRLSAAREGKVG